MLSVRLSNVRKDWTKWAVVTLALLQAGWMAFDGARALIAGDYVTPKSGAHAGELGPWAGLVESIGIEPRSTFMKTIFVVYGATWILVTVAYLRGVAWAAKGMLVAALGALWYLVFGTVASAAQVALLLFRKTAITEAPARHRSSPGRRPPGGSPPS